MFWNFFYRWLFIGLMGMGAVYALIEKINEVPEMMETTGFVRSIEKQCDGLYIVTIEGKLEYHDYAFYYSYLTFETGIYNQLEAYKAANESVHFYFRPLMWSDEERSYKSSYTSYKMLSATLDKSQGEYNYAKS